MKQATYIRYVLAKLSKFVQIGTLTSTGSFYRGFLENEKGSENSFQATFSIEVSDKKFSFVVLHKLAEFHYQAVSASQVSQ